MPAYRFAYLCAFFPFASVHITLIIGVSIGNLDACMPYWADCHSISASGRQMPEFLVFKALLIPCAVLMLFYWALVAVWCRWLHHPAARASHSGYKVAVALGLVSALALVLYTVTLGMGEQYVLPRRIGAVLYFALTALAHLVLLRYLDRLDSLATVLANQQYTLTLTCLLLIGSALLSAGLGAFWPGWERWENAYEWWYAVVMISMFYQVGNMWKVTGLTVSTQLKRPPKL